MTRVYEAMIVVPSSSREHTRLDNETTAIQWCTDRVGPRQPQTSVSVSLDADTFALRNFSWVDGAVVDSGWRLFEPGQPARSVPTIEDMP